MYVLRRYDLNPDLNLLFSSYEESIRSVPTVFNGKRACTLFLKRQTSAVRAQKLGWQDETVEYERHLLIEQELVDSKKLENKAITIKKEEIKSSPKKKATKKPRAAKKKATTKSRKSKN